MLYARTSMNISFFTLSVAPNISLEHTIFFGKYIKSYV